MIRVISRFQHMEETFKFNRQGARRDSVWRRLMGIGLLMAAIGWGAPVFAQKSADDLLKNAQAAFERGQAREALKLVRQAVEVDPANTQALYFSGRLRESLHEYTGAIEDFGAMLKLQPGAANVYQLRGAAHFKAGQISESIADFDKEIELVPGRAPHHWQRGISYYYAKEYEKGRRQFEDHRAVNPNDVENAVWHFLCVVPISGVAKAREVLIPVSGDTRVPMKQIHDLFAGKGSVEAVLDAAREGDSGGRVDRLFYAHLYLGLYEEALGKDEKCREHLLKAVRDFPTAHYMGDVARVHAKLRGYAVTESP